MNTSKKLTKLQIKENEIKQLKKTIKELITSKKSFLNMSTHHALHKQLENKTTLNQLNTFKDVVESHTPLANTLKKVKEEKVLIVEKKKTFRNILKDNKKNISFFVSFYIPKIEDKKAKDIITFEGKEYMGSSRKNGNSGSYQLEKRFTLNTAYLLKQLQNNRMVLSSDLIKFLRLKNIMKSFIGYDELIEAYDNIHSQDEILFILTDIKIDSDNNSPINFNTEQAFYSDNSSKFLSIREYTKIQDEVYKTDYVKDNYIKNSCWLSLLLDIYKAPIEKRYKNTVLTYESLHNIIAPSRMLNDYENGYSIEEVFNFFRMYKLALYVLDINLNIRNFYEPAIRNKNVNPIVIYVIFHDKHIYRIDNNLKKFELKLKEKLDKRVEVCKIPSTKFYVQKRDEDINSRMINSYEELKKIIDEPVEDIKETIDIHILYNKPSCFDLWLEFYRRDIKPSVLMTNDAICFKHMRLDGFNNKNLIISTLEEEGVYSHTEFDDEEIFRHYTSKKNFINNNLLTNNYKSEYSDNVKVMLSNYMKSPIIGKFDNKQYEITKGIKLDFNKFYTSILMNIAKIPVINSFDEFLPYTGLEIKDYNLYFVEKLDSEQTYPLNKFSLCYGINLLGVENIKIISYLQVSKLKKYISKDIVKNIYDDAKLNPKMRKDLINHLVGVYNKKDNKKVYTNVCKYRNEAETIKLEYGGKIIHQSFHAEEEKEEEEGEEFEDVRPKETIYINYIENKNDINDGFRLISLFVYDTAHKYLLNLKSTIESYGLEVYTCNTDCLDIEYDIKKLQLFKNDFPQFFDFINKDDYDAIGKLKIENIMLKDATEIKKFHQEDIYKLIPIVENETNIIVLEDEFNRDEISDKIIDKLIITADIAGAGKSSSFVYNSIKRKENALIICPYNTLCCETNEKVTATESEFINSITLNNLLGMGFDGSTESNKKPYDVTGIDRIVFDEIFLIDIFKLSRIKEYMTRYPNIKFGATGDPYQLSPVEEKLSVENVKGYYIKIVYSLFPNQLNLQENKRCKTDEDRKIMKEMTQEIRNLENKYEIYDICKKYGIKVIDNKHQITSKRNITGTNLTREWVNNTIQQKYHKDNKYFVGMNLICRANLRSKEYRTYVNYRYKIKEIKDKVFVLADSENEFEITTESIHKNFELPYAQTCNSAQGASIDEPITIFDIDSFFVDKYWIYTAITRATSIENITIYKGKVEDKRLELIKQVENMIVSHIHVDLDKGRETVGEYITVKWVLDTLKKVKTCKYCKCFLDTSGQNCFSVDRKSNLLGHTKVNCQVICRNCNVSKK